MRFNQYGQVVHDEKFYESVTFDAAANGTLAAAASGNFVKLHGLVVQSAGTAVVNLTNGNGGASLLEVTLQAREGFVLPLAAAPAYWLKTGLGTDLYVTVSAAVQVTITAIISRDEVE